MIWNIASDYIERADYGPTNRIGYATFPDNFYVLPQIVNQMLVLLDQEYNCV